MYILYLISHFFLHVRLLIYFTSHFFLHEYLISQSDKNIERIKILCDISQPATCTCSVGRWASWIHAASYYADKHHSSSQLLRVSAQTATCLLSKAVVISWQRLQRISKVHPSLASGIGSFACDEFGNGSCGVGAQIFLLTFLIYMYLSHTSPNTTKQAWNVSRVSFQMLGTLD